jgi:hypothetical protein
MLDAITERLSDKEALQYSKVDPILATPAYRTQAIVARLIQAALAPEPTSELATLRARKLLMGIAKHGESAVPGNEMELISWSELSKAEALGALDQIEASTTARVTGNRKSQKKSRHFKNCKQCGTKFLPKRRTAEFHSPVCRLRWNRRHGQDLGAKFGVNPGNVDQTSPSVPPDETLTQLAPL